MSTELLVSQRDDFGEVGATEVPSFNFKKAGSGEGEVCLGSWFLFPWRFPVAGFSVGWQCSEGLTGPVPSGEFQMGSAPAPPGQLPSYRCHKTCQFL